MVEIVCMVYKCLVMYDFFIIVYKDVMYNGIYLFFKVCIGDIFVFII